MTSHTLTSCCPDILTLIIRYLRPEDVYSLWILGDRKFQATVQLSLITFKYTFNSIGSLKWPSIISKFSKLQELEIKNDQSIHSMPCLNHDAKHLPKSLTSIKLSFFNSFCTFMSASNKKSNSNQGNCLDGYINLGTLLPNLTSLELVGEFGLFDSLIPALPQTLRRLILDATSKGLSPISILGLPKSLERLTVPVKFQDSHNAQIQIRFPEPLKVLELKLLDTPHDDSDVSLQFPKSLAELSLLCNAILSPRNWMQVPRQLEKFECVVPKFEPKDLLLLPTTLKILSIHTYSLAPGYVSYLPPNLEKLFLGHQESYSLGDLADLPRGLRSLELGAKIQSLSTEVEVLLLPPRLTSLTILWAAIPPTLLEVLPRTLTELWLPHLDDLGAAFLPPKLKILKIDGGSLSVRGASLLPYSLTELDIKLTVFTDLECFEYLSPNLKILQVSCPWYGNKRPLFSKQRGKYASHYFPTSITKLQLGPYSHFDDCFAITCFQRLRNLVDIRIESIAPSLSASILHFLPDSLQFCNLAIKSNLADEHLSHLPKRLRTLVLKSDGGSLVTEHILSCLPKTLYRLKLPPSMHLSKASLNKLPPFLKSFECGRLSLKRRWELLVSHNAENREVSLDRV